MEHLLRYLTVRLETSGTAKLIENTELYVGSYGFVGLRAFVPVTQNRAEGLKPLCTVHAVATDKFGMRRQLGTTFFNMVLADERTISGKDFLVFERMMPKIFTDTATDDLELLYNYSEVTEGGKLSSRLTTNVLKKSVVEGGVADGDIDIEIDKESQTAAQINENKIAIDGLQEQIDNLHEEIIDISGAKPATKVELGMVKVGERLSIDEDGLLSADRQVEIGEVGQAEPSDNLSFGGLFLKEI